ncbi:twin-arginine translocase subunit TatC [Collinsella vaginalis]|uniref:twin-arginine translocase subunit TatC n=1 Tax=Collinsella vaginalis TaxID=1870987 RepID=UPI0015C4F61C|nr:twin-arginine translocase subunit TatC [Collinsella vaginalis]
MPIGPARMPLFDHLGELRRRLTIVVVSVLAATIVMYFAAPTIVDVLTDPIEPFLKGRDFVITTSLGGFAIKFGIALKVAIVMSTPMIIWQILAFFLPALKPNERKWVVPTVLAATGLFFLGMVFCYFIIVPAGFEWLISETESIAAALPELQDYINIEILLMIGFGVAFELPLIVFYLAVFHIVPYASFRAAWRYIYVIMLVVSASITPDASPVTLIFMYAAMLSLYEISLAVTRFVVVAREGKAGLTKSRLTFLSDDDEDEGDA